MYKKFIFKLIKINSIIISSLHFLNFYFYNKDPLLSDIKKNKNVDYSQKRLEVDHIINENLPTLIERYNVSIDKNWFRELFYQTQLVNKSTTLNPMYGFILYLELVKYLSNNHHMSKNFNILETGTARGYSTLCLAKAINDKKVVGRIYSIDILPHNKKIYWNIEDDLSGKKTRSEILNKWSDLVNRYIFFCQGESINILPKLNLKRIHFAFLDSSHNYIDIKFETNFVKTCQKKGDLIIFDDFNKIDFPGVVRVVQSLENQYDISIYSLNDNRNIAIAKKK